MSTTDAPTPDANFQGAVKLQSPPPPAAPPPADIIVKRSSRRIHLARAALIGLVAGLLAVIFRQTLAIAENARGMLLESLHRNHPAWGWAVLPLIALAAGCIIGWLMKAFAPESGGSGIPHLKGVLIHVRTLSWQRLIPVKFVSGVLGIGSGLSLGREGPTVQMGAAVGRALARPLRTPESDIPQLLSAGAGAGLAAAFNAPLAGLLFVVEELHREMSARTATGALLAAICATVVAQWLSGNAPSFAIHGLAAMPLTTLPLAVLIGIIAGAGGILFSKGLLSAQNFGLTQKTIPRWLLPGLAGMIVGLAAWWAPDAVGGGQGVAERVLTGTLGVGLGSVIILLILKFALSVLSYGSGAPGGIFAPMLLIGALAGAALGESCRILVPGSAVAAQVQALSVLGMTAFFVGAVRAPLTGIVLISEMTGGYELLFPICIAALTAYLMGEVLGGRPIYDALLEEDLLRSGHGHATPEPRTMYIGIQNGSALAGRTLASSALPRGCLVTALERSGVNLFPAADLTLNPGDHVWILIPGDAHEAALEIVRLCTGMG